MQLTNGLVLPNFIYNILYDLGLWRIEANSRLVINKYKDDFIALYNEDLELLIVPVNGFTRLHWNETKLKASSAWIGV